MDKRPSEVFLKLWRFRTTHDDEEVPADFSLCAEAWAEIRRMEDEVAWAALRMSFSAAADGPSMAQATTGPDVRVESAPAEASKNDGEAVVQNGPEQKKSPWEAFRDNTRRKVLNVHFSSQQIAEASGGTATVDDIRALVDGEDVPGGKVSAINKAIARLEGKG